MSKPSPAPEARRAGFTLIEVLVALVIAGLMLEAFGRAFALARSAVREPWDMLSLIGVARLVAAEASHPAAPAEGRRGVVAYRLEVAPVTLLPRTAHVAPPLESDTAAPANDKGPQSFRLRLLTVTAKTPSGRQVRLATVRLDAQAN